MGCPRRRRDRPFYPCAVRREGRRPNRRDSSELRLLIKPLLILRHVLFVTRPGRSSDRACLGKVVVASLD